MSDPMARIEGLRVRRRGFEVADVSLTIPRGTVVGLVGPNGAGKTTTIRALLGLLTPDGGTVDVVGERAGSPAALRATGVVLDRPAAAPDWRVATLGSRFAPFHPAWDQELLAATLDRLRVPTEGRVGELSRGQGVKLAMALALAQRPELLVLDEPSSGLDPAARRELLDLLREFMLDERHGVLLSTHITTDLDGLADELVVLAGGRVVHRDVMPDAVEAFAIARGSGASPTEAVLGVQRSGPQWQALVRLEDSARFGSDVVLDAATIDDILIHLADQVGSSKEVAA